MEKEIKDSEDFLKGLETKGGFQMPEGYIENLHQKVLEKTIRLEPKKARIISMGNIWLKVASVAAVALIVAGLFWFDPTRDNTKQLSEDEILEHLQGAEISAELLCDAGWCNELESLTIPENQTDEQILIDTDTELLIDEL